MKCGPVAKNSTAAATSSDASVPPHRRLLDEVLVGRAHLARHDHPRRHAVHADLRRPRLRHRLREHVQRRLRRAVVPMRRPRMNPAQRADVHDPPLRRLQMRIAPPSPPETARACWSQTSRPTARHVMSSSAAVSNTPALFTSRSSPPERPDDLGHRRVNARLVASHRRRWPWRRTPSASSSATVCAASRLGAAIRDRHIRAGLRQRQRDPTPDAPRRTCNQRSLPA